MIPTIAGSRTYVGPAYHDSRQPVTGKMADWSIKEAHATQSTALKKIPHEQMNQA